MAAMRHVAVVGGGVVGLSCAHFLRQSGVRVTVIDRAGIGSGASHGNCGYVCPSHVLPLTEPGALKGGWRAFLDPKSPLRIGLLPQWSHWWWLWQFARRCNESNMLESARAIDPLLRSSFAIYLELVNGRGLECEWRHRGLLYVYRDRARWEGFAKTDAILRRFDMPAERIEGRDLVEREPALKPGLAGGWFYKQDAHLRPDKLMRSWRVALESEGVAFRERCAVTGFRVAAGRADAVLTEQGPVEADAVIVAAGAMTTLLQKQLGCRIPIIPGKGYSITMPRPSICPAIPMIFPEHRVAVTPMDSGYRLGSMMELVGYDTTLPQHRLDMFSRAAALFLREPEARPVQEQWFGWRPMTPDSRPLIDRAPAAANLLIAAGNNMIGISTGPATGKLAVELLLDQAPHLDPAPYRLSRFG